MKNFHLPLPEQTYRQLRAESERVQVSATVLAREAIDLWLREQARRLRHDEIAAYAAELAGERVGSRHRVGGGRPRTPGASPGNDGMKRGEVYWADLVPRSGSEQTGRRPIIVMSHDGFNAAPAWRSIIVVPISISASQLRRGRPSSSCPPVPPVSPEASVAVCHQVTTLDRAKLTARIGALPPDLLRAVEDALKAALDLE